MGFFIKELSSIFFFAVSILDLSFALKRKCIIHNVHNVDPKQPLLINHWFMFLFINKWYKYRSLNARKQLKCQILADTYTLTTLTCKNEWSMLR